MKVWLKGGLIGAGIGIVFLILVGGIYLFVLKLASNCPSTPGGFWGYIDNPAYCKIPGLAYFSFFFIIIIGLAIFYKGGLIIPLIILISFVIGAIIGLIISKIREKNK